MKNLCFDKRKIRVGTMSHVRRLVRHIPLARQEVRSPVYTCTYYRIYLRGGGVYCTTNYAATVVDHLYNLRTNAVADSMIV